MRLIALISGGKDSFFSSLLITKEGHEIVALANLYPLKEDTLDIDSWSFQTVGHSIIPLFSACMGIPVFRKGTLGKAITKELEYEPHEEDEVEDLYYLLSEILSKIPNIQGIVCGAIFSKYQKNRVENVCNRLNLEVFTPIWQRNQKELLVEMIDSQMEAILIKVACLGLDYRDLGKSISQMKKKLWKLNKLYGINVAGEGGEFETLTLNCPLFKYGRIDIIETDYIVDEDESAILKIKAKFIGEGEINVINI